MQFAGKPIDTPFPVGKHAAAVGLRGDTVVRAAKNSDAEAQHWVQRAKSIREAYASYKPLNAKGEADLPFLVRLRGAQDANGTTTTQTFIAYENVTGPLLGDVVGDLEPASLTSILRYLVDAVQFLHKAGVIHGNIHINQVRLRSGDLSDPMPVLLDVAATWDGKPLSEEHDWRELIDLAVQFPQHAESGVWEGLKASRAKTQIEVVSALKVGTTLLGSANDAYSTVLPPESTRKAEVPPSDLDIVFAVEESAGAQADVKHDGDGLPAALELEAVDFVDIPPLVGIGSDELMLEAASIEAPAAVDPLNADLSDFTLPAISVTPELAPQPVAPPSLDVGRELPLMASSVSVDTEPPLAPLMSAEDYLARLEQKAPGVVQAHEPTPAPQAAPPVDAEPAVMNEPALEPQAEHVPAILHRASPVANAWEKQVEELVNELSTAQTTLRRLEATDAMRAAELERERTAGLAAQKRIAELEDEVAASLVAVQRTQELSASVVALTAERDALVRQSELDAARVAELEGEVASAAAEWESVDARQEVLRIRNLSLNTTNDGLVRDVARLTGEVESLRHKLAGVDLVGAQAARAERAEAVRERDAAVRDAEHLRAEIAELQKSAVAARKEAADASDLLRAAQRENDSFRTLLVDRSTGMRAQS